MFGERRSTVNLGLTRPLGGQVAEAGSPDCPICFEALETPLALSPCGHLFCEDCASEWLDREHTCPLCRASVNFSGDAAETRDLFHSLNAATGATSAYPRLF